MEVTIKKWGNSQGIILPKKLLNAIGVNGANEVLDLTIEGNKIVLQKKDKPLTINDVVKDFDANKYWETWYEEHPNQSKGLRW